LFGDAVRARVGETVFGQDTAVDRILIALLTGGHILLEGVPGVAKTLLAMSIGAAMNLTFGRVQFTIDLLPSDIIGSLIYDQRDQTFKARKGPIFVNILLADEINRASSKVQSALLEAMQERRVTIGEETHDLPTPFIVIATQNPVEQSGTFELPEAQLDRFMLRHEIKHPSANDEERIVKESIALGLKERDKSAVQKTFFDKVEEKRKSPLIGETDLKNAMAQVQKVHVSQTILEMAVRLMRRTRLMPELEVSCSSRACINMVLAARARAYLRSEPNIDIENIFVTPEDVFELAEDVMLHRMRQTYSSRAEGKTSRHLLKQILDEFLPPDFRT
jgi:MoxR-like ATPase